MIRLGGIVKTGAHYQILLSGSIQPGGDGFIGEMHEF